MYTLDMLQKMTLTCVACMITLLLNVQTQLSKYICFYTYYFFLVFCKENTKHLKSYKENEMKIFKVFNFFKSILLICCQRKLIMLIMLVLS